MSDRFGIFFKGDFSFGKEKNFGASGKGDILGYGAHVSLPYRSSHYTALTLDFGYDHLGTKGENFKQSDNSTGFSIFLEDYLRCNQLRCDRKNGYKLSMINMIKARVLSNRKPEVS